LLIWIAPKVRWVLVRQIFLEIAPQGRGGHCDLPEAALSSVHNRDQVLKIMAAVIITFASAVETASGYQRLGAAQK
jgi:hypothetical protein